MEIVGGIRLWGSTKVRQIKWGFDGNHFRLLKRKQDKMEIGGIRMLGLLKVRGIDWKIKK